MRNFAAFPLLDLPVLVYNLVALTLDGGFSAVDAHARMTEGLFTIRMASNVDWPVTLGDLFLAAALVVLFIICLIQFLLAPAFATSTFFLITLMVLLDVLAGFIVTIVAARRDIDFAGNDG